MTFTQELRCAMVTSHARHGEWVDLTDKQGHKIGACRVTRESIDPKLGKGLAIVDTEKGPQAVKYDWVSPTGHLVVHRRLTSTAYGISVLPCGKGLGLQIWDKDLAIELAKKLDAGPWGMAHLDPKAMAICKAMVTEDPEVNRWQKVA